MSDHPTKRVTASGGRRADIDVMLVPLVKALWAAGYKTIGSCQDLGESIGDHAPRRSAYWRGYALLEMPFDDACDLLDAVKDTPQFKDKMHWTAPGAWDVTVPVQANWTREGRAAVTPWAQVHFPNDQIDDLVEVLTAG